MKKMMFAVIMTMLLNTQAFANCNEVYQKAKGIIAAKAGLSTTAAAAGAFVGYFGTVIGLSTIAQGEVLAGTITIVGADAPGVFASASSVQQAVDFHSLNKVYQLINESELIFGNQLSQTAEQLSEELDTFIAEEDVAQIIVDANQEAVFCGNEKQPYDYKSVYAYLVKELQ